MLASVDSARANASSPRGIARDAPGGEIGNGVPPGRVMAVMDSFKGESRSHQVLGRMDFSGCNSHLGTGSLHPVAIEAAVEATKPSERSV